ncbi:hypothetical protein ACFWP5_01620 [Streptomyces sp. NPDC058469]
MPPSSETNRAEYTNPSDLIASGVRITAKDGWLDIDQTIISK